MPPEAGMRVDRADVRLIKGMGFGFVKLLLNPAVLKAGSTLDAASMAYFDQVIDLAAAENFPVVVCIHPEDDFKRRVLGNAAEFEAFVGFMTALSHHLSSRWSSSQVAFQLMTEPYGSSPNPADWNHWDRLQRRLWKLVRAGMPRHTLVLSGDRIGAVEGLADIHPVDDENVLLQLHLLRAPSLHLAGRHVALRRDPPDEKLTLSVQPRNHCRATTSSEAPPQTDEM